MKKEFLATKICPVCKLEFTWRKKWKKKLGKCAVL
ncbi:MAG: DUF2256 domain-containing protein [Chitinophagales bacterium]